MARRLTLVSLVLLLCASHALARTDVDFLRKALRFQGKISIGYWLKKTNPIFCAQTWGDGAQVEIARAPFARNRLTIRFTYRARSGTRSLTIKGHANTSFCVKGGVVYYADYDPLRSGAHIVAYDFEKDRQRWRVPVTGLGEVPHSGYQNLVSVLVSHGHVLVRGFESKGTYLEYHDPKTGALLAHRILERPHVARMRGSDLPYGPVAHGVHAAITAGRTHFHPGENVPLDVYFQSRYLHTRLTMPLTFKHHLTTGETIHIVTPGGLEYVYEGPRERRGATWLDAGATRPLRHLNLFLSTDLPRWRCTIPAVKTRLSMRTPGAYRIWFTHESKYDPGAGTDYWYGSLKSNELSLVVTELPPPARRRELPREHANALAGLPWAYQSRGGPARYLNQLRTEIGLTKNEGLAQHLVTLLRGPKESRPQQIVWWNALLLLRHRAYRPSSERDLLGIAPRVLPGIDGPYLKELVAIALAHYGEEQGPRPHRLLGSIHPDLVWQDVLLAYLKLHPEDAAARKQAIQTVTGRPGPFAWRFLLACGALRPGMTVDEATRLLGPAAKSDGRLVWTGEVKAGKSLTLVATVRDGRVTSFAKGAAK